MKQIPNIEEVVEKMLAIGWDSKLKKHDGTSIVVSFTKAELCDLLLNIEENHHQQLQKARHSLHTSLVEAVEGLAVDEGWKNNGIYTGGFDQAKEEFLTIINSIFKE